MILYVIEIDLLNVKLKTAVASPSSGAHGNNKINHFSFSPPCFVPGIDQLRPAGAEPEHFSFN